MYCERWSSEADAEDLAIPDFRETLTRIKKSSVCS